MSQPLRYCHMVIGTKPPPTAKTGVLTVVTLDHPTCIHILADRHKYPTIHNHKNYTPKPRLCQYI